MKPNNKTTVFDCAIVELPKVHNQSGNITIVEEKQHFPFEIKRIYYLYDVPGGESRGGHAHYDLQQFLVAASGSFDVELDDGTVKKTFSLNRPHYALQIVPGIWRELKNFSSGAICLVLASELYQSNDYIRDYQQFLNLKKCE